MLKRSKKLAMGGLNLSSLFSSVGGVGGEPTKGNLLSKVSSSGIPQALPALTSLIPSNKSSIEQEAAKVNQTSDVIGGGLKQGAIMAADKFAPGAGTLLSATDSIGTSLTKTGKVGKAANAVINPLNSIGNIGKLATGDVTGFIENTHVGALANAVGIDFGDSAEERALKELQKKRDLQAIKDYKANNTGYNAQYGLAKKGMKFQQGGVLESYNTDNNVILKGVLHSQKNSIGDKGIPVMSCVNNKCEKVAEIEKEELVFTKGNTKIIDSYVTKYNKSKTKSVRDTIALQLGKFIKQQLDKNTIDNTDKML